MPQSGCQGQSSVCRNSATVITFIYQRNYLSPSLYKKILSTYSNHEVENNWKALFTMTELFGELSFTVAEKLHFQYNAEEEKNVKKFLEQSYEGRQ